jgi:hypothetical protein
MTRERVAEVLAVVDYPEWCVKDYEQARWRAVTAGEAVKALTEELLDPEEQLMTPENIITILSDVGSLYRVNWDEIGSHFIESGE